MQTVVNVILPIFGLLFLGWLSRHYKVLTKKSIHPLNAFVFYLALPALIFISLYEVDILAISDTNFLLANLLGPLLLIIIMFIALSIMRVDKKIKAVFLVGSFFGNVAYMGYPVNQLAFGEQGLALAVIISSIYLVIGLTIGDFVFQYYSPKKMRMLRMLENLGKTPIVWALILGIIFSLWKPTIPTAIISLLTLLGVCAGPVALFSIGLFIYGNPLKGKVLKEGIILSIIKMTALPLCVLLFVKLFGVTGMKASISIMQAAMPLAVTTFVFAEEFKVGERLTADAVILSTMLSIIPVTVLLLIFG